MDPVLNSPVRSHMSAAKITRQSKSNLALAFISLGRERKRDITVFYAFCRVIDDIADSSELSVIEKRVRLAKWRQMLHAAAGDDPLLARDVRHLIAKYSLPVAMLEEIIAGVEMDLSTLRYPTFEELRIYCYRVASAVGLVSIEIFGYTNPGCRRYALDLGMALQLINIIRDVGQDLANGGRIYLPLQDLDRFGYSEKDLRERVYDDRFVALMEYEADRTRTFFHSARVHLPPEDRRSMRAAEIMGAVYSRLLRRMKADRFRVFEKRYSLNGLEKSW